MGENKKNGMKEKVEFVSFKNAHIHIAVSLLFLSEIYLWVSLDLARFSEGAYDGQEIWCISVIRSDLWRSIQKMLRREQELY